MTPTRGARADFVAGASSHASGARSLRRLPESDIAATPSRQQRMPASTKAGAGPSFANDVLVARCASVAVVSHRPVRLTPAESRYRSRPSGRSMSTSLSPRPRWCVTAPVERALRAYFCNAVQRPSAPRVTFTTTTCSGAAGPRRRSSGACRRRRTCRPSSPGRALTRERDPRRVRPGSRYARARPVASRASSRSENSWSRTAHQGTGGTGPGSRTG